MNNIASTAPTNRVTWLLLGIILLLGAYFRIEAVSNTVIDHPIRADAKVYYFSALNLSRWHIFSSAPPADTPPAPDAFVQPGFPFAIQPLLEWPPTDRMVINITMAQAALGLLTILFTFLFFREISNEQIALGAALLTAASPHLISMSTYVLTETLFTFLLMASVWLAAFAISRKNTLFAVMAGLALGASALTRATTEYLPLFLLLAYPLIKDKPLFIKQILPIILGSLSVIAAWKVRNYLSIGAFSDPKLFLSTLHHGMYPEFMYNQIPASRGIPYRFDPASAEIGSNLSAILTELQHRAAQSPGEYLYWYFIGKPISLLSWELVDGAGDIFVYPVIQSPFVSQTDFIITRLVFRAIYPLLVILGVFGGILALWRPAMFSNFSLRAIPLAIAPVIIIYFFAVHFLGAPYARYGIPLHPMVFGLGLMTVSLLWRFGHRRLSMGATNHA